MRALVVALVLLAPATVALGDPVPVSPGLDLVLAAPTWEAIRVHLRAQTLHSTITAATTDGAAIVWILDAEGRLVLRDAFVVQAGAVIRERLVPGAPGLSVGAPSPAASVLFSPGAVSCGGAPCLDGEYLVVFVTTGTMTAHWHLDAELVVPGARTRGVGTFHATAADWIPPQQPVEVVPVFGQPLDGAELAMTFPRSPFFLFLPLGYEATVVGPQGPCCVGHAHGDHPWPSGDYEFRIGRTVPGSTGALIILDGADVELPPA